MPFWEIQNLGVKIDNVASVHGIGILTWWSDLKAQVYLLAEQFSSMFIYITFLQTEEITKYMIWSGVYQSLRGKPTE